MSTITPRHTVASLSGQVDALRGVVENMIDVIERQNEEIESCKRHIAGLERGLSTLAAAAAAAPVVPQPVGPVPVKLMNARYRGHCAGCGREFAGRNPRSGNAGHTIAYGNGKAWHPACSPVDLFTLADEREIKRHPVSEYEDRRRDRM